MDWKYTNEELNDKIAAICDNDNGDRYEVVGGKSIFYWGWYWRDVYFDSPHYKMAICDDLVGFCQNNEWGYYTFLTTPEQSHELRKFLEVVVDNPTDDNMERLYNLMHSFPSERDWKMASDGEQWEDD